MFGKKRKIFHLVFGIEISSDKCVFICGCGSDADDDENNMVYII